MTTHVRDEADVIEAQLAFHLNAGVDFVIATDHRSADGTTEILESFARQGVLHLIREHDERMSGGDWRSRMADLASDEYRADWVFSADADEFWWPRGGSLRDVLGAVPSRYGVVRAVSRHFAPRPDDGTHFAERMVARVSPYSSRTRLDDPFHSWIKVAHRGCPGLEVHFGSHDVEGGGLLTLRGWHPIEVLHYPLRSPEQARRKYLALGQGRAYPGEAGVHVERAREEIETGRWEQVYAGYVVNDATLEHGLAEGGLVRDTRLRDALRELCGVAPLPPAGASYGVPRDGGISLAFPPFDVVAAAFFAHELQPTMDGDSVMRIADRVLELEERAATLELGLSARLRRRARRVFPLGRRVRQA